MPGAGGRDAALNLGAHGRKQKPAAYSGAPQQAAADRFYRGVHPANRCNHGRGPHTGTLGYSDSLYFCTSLLVVPPALAFFASPEIAGSAIQRKSLVAHAGRNVDMCSGQMRRVRDVFRHWFAVLRCNSVGTALSAVPSNGASVVDKIADGHAVRT